MSDKIEDDYVDIEYKEICPSCGHIEYVEGKIQRSQLKSFSGSIQVTCHNCLLEV